LLSRVHINILLISLWRSLSNKRTGKLSHDSVFTAVYAIATCPSVCLSRWWAYIVHIPILKNTVDKTQQEYTQNKDEK